MKRTTEPAVETLTKAIVLSDSEFDSLMSAQGSELVEVNPGDVPEDAVEVVTECGKMAEMIFDAPMKKAMASCGITKEFLAEKLNEALDATKCTVFLDQKTGKILYSKDLVYWKVREDARRDAHTLLRHYPPERQEVSGPNGSPINLKTGPAVQAIIREIQISILGGENSDPPVDGG